MYMLSNFILMSLTKLVQWVSNYFSLSYGCEFSRFGRLGL